MPKYVRGQATQQFLRQTDRIGSNISGFSISGLHPGNPYKKFGDFGSPWKGLNKLLGIVGKETISEAEKLIQFQARQSASRKLILNITKLRQIHPGIGTDIVRDFLNVAKQMPGHEPKILGDYLSGLKQSVTLSERTISKEEFASLLQNKLEGLHPNNPNKKFNDFGSGWKGTSALSSGLSSKIVNRPPPQMNAKNITTTRQQITMSQSGFIGQSKIPLNRNQTSTRSRKMPSY